MLHEDMSEHHMNQVPVGTCLQCDETRANVRKRGLFCGIESNTEAGRELVEDWDRHRWADWTTRELNALGILPEFHRLYARANLLDLRALTPCEHKGREHTRDEQPGGYVMCTACWTDLEEDGK